MPPASPLHCHPPDSWPATDGDTQVVAKYLTRFQCIRERCEDTCCAGWTIAVDVASYGRLSAVLGQTELGRAQLAALELAPESTRTGEYHAQIVRNESGACPFLNGQRLCSIQTDHGEEALCVSCSVFPRTAVSHGHRLEVGGSLACPEIARLVLLSDEGLELCAPSGAALPRPYIGRSVSRDPDDAYAGFFEVVRAAALETLQRAEYPLAVRLVFLADLADRVKSFFYKDTRHFDEPNRALSERRLAKELSVLGVPDYLAGLEYQFTMFTAQSAPFCGFVAALLHQRRALPHTERFAALLRQVFGSYVEEALGHAASADDAITEAQLDSVYRRRRAVLDARFQREVDRLFARYATHYWQRHPYTSAPSLLDHVCKLGVRLAALRFLFLGHPAVVSHLGDARPHGGSTAAFETAVVEVVQSFAKAIEHHPEFLRIIDSSFVAEGPQTLGRALCLARFY